VGGVHTVLLGDDETRQRGLINKSILERREPPAFTVAVEMVGPDCWYVHHDVAASVDALLAGRHPQVEVRTLDQQGGVVKTALEFTDDDAASPRLDSTEPVRRQSLAQSLVYTYAVRDSFVKEAIRMLDLEGVVQLTTDLELATGVIATRAAVQTTVTSWVRQQANELGVPIYAIRRDSVDHAVKALQTM
jgi:hypothetical protein